VALVGFSQGHRLLACILHWLDYIGYVPQAVSFVRSCGVAAMRRSICGSKLRWVSASHVDLVPLDGVAGARYMRGHRDLDCGDQRLRAMAALRGQMREIDVFAINISAHLRIRRRGLRCGLVGGNLRAWPACGIDPLVAGGGPSKSKIVYRW